MGEVPEGWIGSDLRARAEIVQWLAMQGGEVSDDNGLVVGRLRSELRKGRAVSQLIADMANDGMIERDVRGRRTFRLTLVDDWGLVEQAREHQSWQIQQPAGTSLAQGSTPNGEVHGEVDYDELAQRLLTLVLAQSRSAASSGVDTNRLKQQVEDLTAERNTLRDALVEARTEAEEQRRQSESMRESLVKFKAQMDKKPPRGGTPLGEQLRAADRKLLERLMREVPAGR